MNIEIIRKIDRIHSYPAKFTVDLALEYISKYSKEGDVIYDPFVGSGTTLLASKLLNRESYGTDVNHIAVLISRFKLLNLQQENFDNLEKFYNTIMTEWRNNEKVVELFTYPSINHWFKDDAIFTLSFLKKHINRIKIEDERIFSDLIFSSIVNSVSNQDSDTRYAAIEKPKINLDYCIEVFSNKFKSTLKLFREFSSEIKSSKIAKIALLDSKHCTELITDRKVDLIFTSPPYPNTYDYYLYHKHRMNWLEKDVQFSMKNEIGSRREFSSLKREKEKFNADMFAILSECNKILKSDGHVILVMGDGKIQGEVYEAKSNMIDICKNLNFDLIDYSFTYLDNTSKSFQKSYRTKGKKEHILVFRKR